MPKTQRDLVGFRSRSWTVLYLDDSVQRNGGRRWMCRCDCGSERTFGQGYVFLGPSCDVCKRNASNSRQAPESKPVTRPEPVEVLEVDWANRETPLATLTPCYYCGMPADTVDHVVPRVLLYRLASLDDKDVSREFLHPSRKLLVPSCRDCNCSLGSRYFDTLGDRKAYIKRRIQVRRRDDLETPDWTEAELAMLAPRLQGYIREALERRRIARKRLQW